MAKDRPIFAYLMLNERNRYIKIGSSHAPRYREKTLQSEEPEIVLLAISPGGVDLERAMHLRYKDFRLRGEWFRLEPDHVAVLVMDHGFEVVPESYGYVKAFLNGQSVAELIDLRNKVDAANGCFEMMANDEAIYEMGGGCY